MRVTVRWFAVLREVRGTDAETVEVEAGTTAGALYRRLVPPPRVPVMVAVDRRWAGLDAELADGAEVAFVPPVGGG